MGGSKREEVLCVKKRERERGREGEMVYIARKKRIPLSPGKDRGILDVIIMVEQM